MIETPSLDLIRSLEEALHDPAVRRSREALGQMLSADFVEFGASGSVYDRTTTINLLEGEGDDEGNVSVGNYTLKPISSGAVLLTYETERVHRDGSKWRCLRSSIWKREGTTWKLLFHQGTVRPQP